MAVMTGHRASRENCCQETCRSHQCPDSAQDRANFFAVAGRRHGWDIEVLYHLTPLLEQKDSLLGRSGSVWRRKCGEGNCLALSVIGVFLYLSLYLLLLILLLLLFVFLSHCYFQWIVLISIGSLVVILNWKIPVLNHNNQLPSNFCLSFLMLPMWTSLLSVLQIEKRGGRQAFPSPLLHATWPWRMGRKFWNVWLKHALVYIYFSWSEMSKSFHSFFFFSPFVFMELSLSHKS